MVLCHIAECVGRRVPCNIHFLSVHCNGIQKIPLVRLIADSAVMVEFHAVIHLDIFLPLYGLIPVRVINADPAVYDLRLHRPVRGSRLYLVALHRHAVEIYLAAIVKIIGLCCPVHGSVDNKRIRLTLISHRTGQIG